MVMVVVVGTCILVEDSCVQAVRHLGFFYVYVGENWSGLWRVFEDGLVELEIRFLYGLMSPDVGLGIAGRDISAPCLHY